MLLNTVVDGFGVVGEQDCALVEFAERQVWQRKSCLDWVRVGPDDLGSAVHAPGPPEFDEVLGEALLLEAKVEARLWPPHSLLETGQFCLVFGAEHYGRGDGWRCRLTFELTPTAEAGAVRPGGDDGTAGAARPYSACRSGSGVEREGILPGIRKPWEFIMDLITSAFSLIAKSSRVKYATVIKLFSMFLNYSIHGTDYTNRSIITPL